MFRFRKYQMNEGTSVTEQAHLVMHLIHHLYEADIPLPEKFLVMSVIEYFFMDGFLEGP